MTFSEKIDPKTALDTSNYKCFEVSTKKALQIYTAILRDGNEIDLNTSVQSRTSYNLLISGVQDLFGNTMGLQKMKFMGSETRDLNPPRIISIYPEDGSTNFQPDSEIIVRFSEVIDTSSILRNCGLLPEGVLRTDWDKGMTAFRFFPGKLDSGEVYSFYLKDGCRDLDENRIEGWTFLTFTPDSTLPGGWVGGNLSSDEKGTSMIALVDGLLRIVRIVLISDGTFRVNWLKPGGYTILAGMDVDNDRRFDLIAHQEVEIGEEGVTVELRLKEEKERWRIFERLEGIFMAD